MYYIGIFLLIIKYSSFVISETTHINTTPSTAIDIYSKSSNWKNFHVKDSLIKWYSNSLQIINEKANAILSDAFDGISSPSIETLQLDLADGRLYIDSSCFLNFQNLKNLEINSASVLLNPYSFYGLKNLTYLKIKLDNETARHIDKILYQQLHLNKLELVDNHDSNICYSTKENKTINLLQLHYTGGLFKTLPHNSFVCFGNLRSITITGSELMLLEPGAFNGLKKLETISLTSNDKLTHVPSNVFNVQSLEIINLSNNSISTIDNEALKIDNSKLSLVNLSHNSLEIIEQGSFRNIKCHFIDLTQSGIIGIVDGAFNTSRINIIDLMENKILRFNSFKWGINYTITLALLDIITFDIATSSSFNDSQIFRMSSAADKFTISNNSFAGLPNLKVLEIKTKPIQLKTPVFYDLQSLIALEIPMIEPQEFQCQSFSNLQSLEELVLVNYNTVNICYGLCYTINFDHVFTIYPESFEGLKNLENLELNVGPIVLKASLFDKLPSLKYLKIEVEETLQYLSQVLGSLKNLKTLEIVGNDTIGICQNAFSYKIPHSLTDVRYTNGNITNLQANSMACMPQLEKLIITNTQLMTIEAKINSASVLLNPYSFYGLKNLTYLKIKLDNETARHIDKILYQQLHLNKLELVDNHDSNICYSTKENKTINLLQLHYTGGLFKTLPHNSFVCFGNLRSIIITRSELMLLEPGAFNGLKKLETISLTSNNKLTHVPSNVFNVQSLEIINLSNNSISTIDNEALKIDNSKLTLVNLSHNSLEIIEQGSFRNIKCQFIDLTQSGIIGIVDGAFNTARLPNLKVLEIKTKPIQLKTPVFYDLQSLIALEIPMIEPQEFQCQSFSNLQSLEELLKKLYNISVKYWGVKNLKTLEVVGNDTIGICQNAFSYKIPYSLTDVRYKNGMITNLQANSMTCMPQLEKLIITNTQLMTIQAGTFKSMNNLKYLGLESNKITRIKKES
ncbi:chaoptin-like [Aphidius gifuensis]|uniref:chaoptin-like n=1 Tax=Aphidius gifuensis TaxID=684658 RepID=UPI001CDCB172|nr:chaoptin-like [Aphidius gifuensis]